MTHYGKIHSYDADKGAGMIMPETGGDALPFNKADLQQQAQVPMAEQRYGYQTKQIDGGKSCAVNLQMEQAGGGSMQQGESDNRSDQQNQSESRSGQHGDSEGRQNQQGQNPQGGDEQSQNGRGTDRQG